MIKGKYTLICGLAQAPYFVRLIAIFFALLRSIRLSLAYLYVPTTVHSLILGNVEWNVGQLDKYEYLDYY